MNTRLNKLRNKFEELELDALLVTDVINRRYLSGFNGAYALFITKKDALLFTDFTYFERALSETEGFSVCKFPRPKKEESKPPTQRDFIFSEIEKFGLKKIGFEADAVVYSFYEELSKKLPSILWKPTKKVVENVREIKSAEELNHIRRAAAIADEAFRRTMEYLIPGIRESEIRAHLNYFIQTLGGFNESFDIIVACGPRGAVPHAMTSDAVIQERDLIVIDYGASYRGYCSDCTRTILLGEPDERQSSIYKLVEHAQQSALSIVAPGVDCKAVDKIARDILAREGYIEEFGHSTGHGVGLVIHEGPSLSSVSEDKFKPGMVITVEPGLYFSGWGGIRIEDMVIVTEQGFDLLTNIPHVLSKNF